MSAGEFSAFDFSLRSAKESAKASVWAAYLGNYWHRAIRAEDSQTAQNVAFEVPLKAEFDCKGWHFTIAGKADELFDEGDFFVAREIKTTRRQFPLDGYELPHKVQLCVYLFALSKKCRCSGELLYVNTDTGRRQKFAVNENPEHAIMQRAAEFTEYLSELEAAGKTVALGGITLPFKTLREGQKDAIDNLKKAIKNNKVVSFKAFTAFGKTAIAFDAMLALMRDAKIERAVCLSSKSSGQMQLVGELKKFLKNADYPRVFQLRNRAEHILNGEYCFDCENCQIEYAPQSGDFSFSHKNYFKGAFSSLEKIRESASEYGVCPYAISQVLLAYSQIWICDYNYIFSPSVSSVLENIELFNPKKTMLIVDEAHNLLERTESAYSGQVSFFELSVLRTALIFDNSSLRAAVELLMETVLCTKGSVPCEKIACVKSCLSQVVDNLYRINFDEFAVPAKKVLWNLCFLNRLCSCGYVGFLWTCDGETLKIDCIDATAAVCSVLDSFKKTLLLSAGDIDKVYPEIFEVKAVANWLKACYKYIIDKSVNTSARTRALFYEDTANRVLEAVKASEKPVAVFFASYEYARAVADVLGRLCPEIKVAMQRKNLTYLQQVEFIKESLANCNALFLVLASSYSESVDILGGAVDTAVVVGVGFSELNAVCNAKMDLLIKRDMSKSEAFDEVYSKKAAAKIKQAIGRLVRSPDQRATVVLHCCRFLQKPFSAYFAEEIAAGEIVGDLQSYKNALQNAKK